MRFATENIYCTKCGLRGYSKCPHCRSIFDSYEIADTRKLVAQNFLEQFTGVRAEGEEHIDGDLRYQVYFWTYAKNSQEAMEKVYSRLAEIFAANPDIKVAACIHEWDFLPGEQSHCGCGHYGAEGATVPADPFAEK